MNKKIPFDIKYRPQIESGEYKVIDRFGYVLTLRDIINDAWYFSLRYPNTDYETERIYDHPENHLFIVTPEEEMTEFEKRLFEIRHIAKKDMYSEQEWQTLRNESAELLALAREELLANDTVLEEYAQVSKEQGKAEALKDLPRWEKCADCTPKPKYSNEWIFSIDSENVTRESAIVHKGYFLPLDGLEKLPGFKEDEE